MGKSQGTSGEDAFNGRPNCVDLFAGVGGMSLGLEQAGFDVDLAVEMDPIHVLAYRRNFPHTEVQAGDLTRMSSRDLEERLPSSDVHLVCGGPSCQGFSEIGRRNPADPRNRLIHKFVELATALQPAAIVMENVEGLVYSPNISEYEDAVRAVEAAEYVVISPPERPLVLDASDFGVPQRRRRVFLVAIHRDQLAADIEDLLSLLRPAGPGVTVSEALDDLPNASEFPSLRDSDSVYLTQARHDSALSAASSYARELRKASQAVAWPRTAFDSRRLTNSARTNHRADVIERFRRTDPGTVEPKSRLPRLDGNGPAPTIRAGTSRDHGSFTSARPIHHRYPRVVTVREAARLHSYPDWFRFHRTKWHAFRQIGNSVPPPLARVVGVVVREALSIPEPVSPEDGVELGNDEGLGLSLNEAAPVAGLDLELLPEDSRRGS